MLRFNEFEPHYGLLSEAANTDAADVNEILFGLYLAKGSWSKFEGAKEAKAQIEKKRKKIGDDAYQSQDDKAKAMTDELLQWAKKNKYSGIVTKVWWTARPGVLSKAVGVDVDSRKNPTDILIKFSDGEFLGLSAKSTKKMGDIGFKNPGMGTVETNLSIELSDIATDAIKKLIKKYPDLPKASSKRKAEIRADDDIKSYANGLGVKVLRDIRNRVYDKLTSMNQSDIKKYLLTDWMDATDSYPRYVKVTGMKVGAKVEDPQANSKIAALSAEDVVFSKVGNDSVGVKAGKKKIMKIRSKYESQKLASSVKFSGDPWS